MVKYTDLISDTICSQITAPGYSGVAVIRVSGPKSLDVLSSICRLPSKDLESHRAYLTTLRNPLNGERIDSVLVTYFETGRSFTGDSVIEISCHGNPLLVQNIIQLFLDGGCRRAERGEFSFRAFYNGQIDLVQAESINQLIHSSHTRASAVALDQLDGALSLEYKNLEREFLGVIGQLEASIDFSEQDIDPDSYDKVIEKSVQVLSTLSGLVDSYHIGKNLMARWSVVLAGETNVGKSSLFNSLFQKDLAIVSDIHGTTRDPVSRDMFLGAHSIQFVDSAGLRSDPGEIESLGIQKSLTHIQESEVVLWVFDASKGLPDDPLLKNIDRRYLLVANKIDLISEDQAQNLERSLRKRFPLSEVLKVSALNGLGVSELRRGIQGVIDEANQLPATGVVTQSRHYDHLVKMQGFLAAGLDLLRMEESPDIVSQEFQSALMELNSLLGKTYDDEVLDTIFGEFCLGK